ncbi:hypothetical protein ACP70R_003102 [Stipagrostis hirtigluma subsp. patula]
MNPLAAAAGKTVQEGISRSAMSLELRRTASTCTMAAETGAHTFEIDGYSTKKGNGVGYFVRSATFAVGGFDWAIRFYPDGTSEPYTNYVVVYLELLSHNAEVRAHYQLRFVGRHPEKDGLAWYPSGGSLFKSGDLTDDGEFVPQHSGFLLRSKLEQWFVHDDRLMIQCDLTVIKSSISSHTGVDMEIPVPPSDMAAHFASLLEDKDGVDVTFSVAGQTFTAHKAVLAARSPVFKAELFGPAREMRTAFVTIQDMNPLVFRALLHFIYTDVLPSMFDPRGHDYTVMVRRLLVAADRYAIERLKLVCQNILAKGLDVEKVATTLDLAQQHGFHKLRDVCIEFMASLNPRDAMVATQPYAELRRSCPSVLAAVFDRRNQLRKT